MPEIFTVNDALELFRHEHPLGLNEREVDELTCLQHRCTERLFERKKGAWRLLEFPQQLFRSPVRFEPSTPKETIKNVRGLKPAVIESLLMQAVVYSNDLNTTF